MTRIRIEPIDKQVFTTSLLVRVTDINYGQHVGHDTLLGFLHESRTQFLGQHGWSEMDVGGCGLIMVDAELEYKGQAFLGEELLIVICPADYNAAGFSLLYEVNAGERLILRARTGLACFDYKRQRVCRMPGPFREALEAMC